MVIYVVEIGSDMFAFDSPDMAARETVACIRREIKKSHQAKKFLYTDYGGMQLLEVQTFNEEAIASYLSQLKVHRKLILHVDDAFDMTQHEASIRKVILEEDN